VDGYPSARALRFGGPLKAKLLKLNSGASSTAQVRDQRNHEQHKEHKEQELGYSGGRDGNTGKAKHCCHNRYE
jgi:hypothetical protein